MNKVGGYGSYQNTLYDTMVQGKKEKNTSRAAKVEENEKNGRTELSSRAQKLLEDLQKRYKNMDFMVSSWKTDAEADAYMARGTKQYSVLIDPDTLEKMASDEETRNQFTNVLNKVPDQFDKIKKDLGDKADEVTSLGISINGKGEVSYFAELEQMGEKQQERIKEIRENKKEEAAKQEKSAKRAKIKADSIEELLEKIRQVDWTKIDAEPEKGSRVDFRA